MSTTTKITTLDQIAVKIERFHDQGKLPRKKTGDLITAIKTFCEWIHSSSRAIIATELAIDTLVRQHSLGHAALGIERRTFTNIIGRVKSTIRLANTSSSLPSLTRKSGYCREWRVVSDELDRLREINIVSVHHRRGIAHLMGWANWRGILPGDLSSDHVAELLQYHHEHGSKGRKAYASVAAWNALVAAGTVQSLPRRHLTAPSRRREVNPDWSTYPESLTQELEMYINWLRGQRVVTRGSNAAAGEFADLHVPSARPARDKKVSQKHATTVRMMARQTAGALVRSGADASRIRSLADLTSSKALDVSLTDIRTRLSVEGRFFPSLDVDADAEAESGSESGYRALLAQIMISMAEEWVRQPQEEIARMREMLGRVRPGHQGFMSPRRRAMLAAFDDAQRRLAWHNAASDLMAKAERVRGRTGLTEEALADMEVALAISILRSLPVRAGNLASIRLKGDASRRNLILPRRRSDPVFVKWDAWEVKNDQCLKAALSDEAVGILRIYLQYYWPYALKLRGLADSDFLFPSEAARGHLLPTSLNQGFKKRMAALGLAMTLHLARHLAAKIVLKRDPDKLVVVSQLLGHSSLETTRRFYCEAKTDGASEIFKAAVLDDAQKIAASARRHAKPRRRSAAGRDWKHLVEIGGSSHPTEGMQP
jgi:integrase